MTTYPALPPLPLERALALARSERRQAGAGADTALAPVDVDGIEFDAGVADDQLALFDAPE